MPEQLVMQALAALKGKDFLSARNYMAEYKRTQPFELRHYLILGLAEMTLEAWQDSAATFIEAAERYPAEAQIWFNLGIAQENLRALEKAAASYERSLNLKPDEAETCGNLSNIYCRLARFAEAEAMARRAIELGAPRAQALNSLGLALNRQNKFVEAETAFDEARRLEPENVLILSNLANCAVDQLDFTRAWILFAEARRSGDAPLIRQHEGMARLLAGDFAEGWKYYEARLELPHALRVQPLCPPYRGEPLSGKKLLLIAEQGFGDTIQFCRYGALLEKSGVEILWVVQKNLQELLAANLPGRVFAETDALPAADYYLPLLSLPPMLGLLRPEEAPSAPYLKIPHPVSPALPAEPLRKIGIIWKGSPTHERDWERSIPLAKLAPLWGKIAARFYAPFIGTGLGQIAGQPVTRLDHLITDFAATAALLGQLDCLVTVDTAAAHLAGALEIKTFLLLPYCPDWRWGIKGETTPWYPALTLLRQMQPGDWSWPVERLVEMLCGDG